MSPGTTPPLRETERLACRSPPQWPRGWRILSQHQTPRMSKVLPVHRSCRTIPRSLDRCPRGA
eukprot:5341665-Pyramimonas_sp.AAC.1